MSKLDVLKQFNLTDRPNPRQTMGGTDAKEGIVINVVRRLPVEVFKKSRNLPGYKTVMSERAKEFETELPVEGDVPLRYDRSEGEYDE